MLKWMKLEYKEMLWWQRTLVEEISCALTLFMNIYERIPIRYIYSSILISFMCQSHKLKVRILRLLINSFSFDLNFTYRGFCHMVRISHFNLFLCEKYPTRSIHAFQTAKNVSISNKAVKFLSLVFFFPVILPFKTNLTQYYCPT